METKMEIPSLINIEEDVKTLTQKYIIFEKSIDELIKLLGIKTGLPINEMNESGQDYPTTYTTTYGSSSLHWSYLRRFANKKNLERRLELTFFINGTINVKLYWSNKSQKDIKYLKINSQEFIDLALKIKEHLDP